MSLAYGCVLSWSSLPLLRAELRHYTIRACIYIPRSCPLSFDDMKMRGEQVCLSSESQHLTTITLLKGLAYTRRCYVVQQICVRCKPNCGISGTKIGVYDVLGVLIDFRYNTKLVFPRDARSVGKSKLSAFMDF